MNVVDWSLSHRVHADSLVTHLRAAGTRLAELLRRRLRRRPDTVIRVPPISTDWVRAYERRKRGDS